MSSIQLHVAKSITSTLIGLAVADGHIHSIDDPIIRYVPELKGSAYDGVTIRQALMMRSIDFLRAAVQWRP